MSTPTLYARSRPRVKPIGGSRTESYSHPRFLKLCDELARLDKVKKGREAPSSSHCSTPKQHPKFPPKDPINDHSSFNPTTSNYANRRCQLQLTGGCSNVINNIEAHSANNFMSVHCNQYTVYGNYYRQNDQRARQFNEFTYLTGPQNSYSINQQQYHPQEPYRLNNTPMFHHPQNHSQNHPQHPYHNLSHQNCLIQTQTCAICRFAPMNLHQTDNYMRLGQLIVPPVQGSVNLVAGTTNPDPSNMKQRESRSKRKRSDSNELPNQSSRKAAPQVGSTSPSDLTKTKKRKSSPEARPLSPSFTKCPICLLDCMDRDPSFTDTCFHLFCHFCIESWSNTKATCPLCRTKFSKIIYNIKSSECYDEKFVIRREEDDEQAIYEQLQNITSNSTLASHQPAMRNQNTFEGNPPQLPFDFRPPEVLLHPLPYMQNQLSYQQLESLRQYHIMSHPNNNRTI